MVVPPSVVDGKVFEGWQMEGGSYVVVHCKYISVGWFSKFSPWRRRQLPPSAADRRQFLVSFFFVFQDVSFDYLSIAFFLFFFVVVIFHLLTVVLFVGQWFGAVFFLLETFYSSSYFVVVRDDISRTIIIMLMSFVAEVVFFPLWRLLLL